MPSGRQHLESLSDRHRKVTKNRMKNSGPKVQKWGQDLLVGFLPGLIVFILKMIPNSWASDHHVQIPPAAGRSQRAGQKICETSTCLT